MVPTPKTGSRPGGFTLLEVLIAISVFALIGVGSFRVLSSIIDSQEIGDQHSLQLAQFQKALRIVDRDLQQLVDRPVRVERDRVLPSLMVYSGDFALELTRSGWRNPLQLPRSGLQRVAYDIGLHPGAGDENSPFYGDNRQYLLRIYWPQLDRSDDTQPVVQPLLADVEDLQVTVISTAGRHRQWPLKSPANRRPELKALEFSVTSSAFGVVSRLYSTPAL